MPDLAIVVVSYNTAALLEACLRAVIDRTRGVAIEIIVVDNNSSDDSVAMVRREFPMAVVVAQSVNAGFGAANNVGVRAATADHVMLLNSDAVLLEDTGTGLVRYLRDHPAVRCVGPRILLPDGRRQPRVFGNQPSLWRIAMQSISPGSAFRRQALFEGVDGRERPGPEDVVGWISGVCMVMRRADYLAVGGFDPAFFMYCEDIDLCDRLAQGQGRIVRLDKFGVLHHGGASSSTVASQVRNAIWAQRNLLKIVRRQSGGGRMRVARLLLSLGLLLRIFAGLVDVPRRGLRDNVLLRSSWLRLRDLIAPLATVG